MMFTKQHYEKIAEVIAQYPGQHNRTWWGERFATMLEIDNPNFDREKFIKACYA